MRFYNNRSGSTTSYARSGEEHLLGEDSREILAGLGYSEEKD